MMSITVIIVNWNSGELLAECLNNLTIRDKQLGTEPLFFCRRLKIGDRQREACRDIGRFCDRAILLDGGKIVQDIPDRELSLVLSIKC
jgi:hypothetical protein